MDDFYIGNSHWKSCFGALWRGLKGVNWVLWIMNKTLWKSELQKVLLPNILTLLSKLLEWKACLVLIHYTLCKPSTVFEPTEVLLFTVRPSSIYSCSIGHILEHEICHLGCWAGKGKFLKRRNFCISKQLFEVVFSTFWGQKKIFFEFFLHCSVRTEKLHKIKLKFFKKIFGKKFYLRKTSFF